MVYRNIILAAKIFILIAVKSPVLDCRHFNARKLEYPSVTTQPILPDELKKNTEDVSVLLDTEKKINEGLLGDTFYNVIYPGNTKEAHKSKDVYIYKPINIYYKNNDTKTCYSFVESSGRDSYVFNDISSIGEQLSNFSSDIGTTNIQLQTSFPFFDKELTTPILYISAGGYVSFEDITESNLGIQDPTTGPYNIIAPYGTSLTLNTGPPSYITTPIVYVYTDTTESIIQWEINELAAVVSGLAGGVFQLRISESGSLTFSYKISSCYKPISSVIQVGVKPSAADLADSYKTSFFQSTCQKGTYVAPRGNTSILMERSLCKYLIDQTGIVKTNSTFVYKSKQKYYKDHFEKKELKPLQGSLLDKLY